MRFTHSGPSQGLSVLMTTFGSTGDHYPLFAIARELRARGHRVTFAATDYFREDVAACGLEHLWIPPRWDRKEFAAWMHRMMASRTPLELLRLLYRSLGPVLPEKMSILEGAMKDHDIVVGSFLTPFLRPLAHRNGIPYVSAAFSHGIAANSTAPAPPIPPLPSWTGPLQRAWARAWWSLTDYVIAASFERECGAARRSAGIPRIRRFFSDPADEVLVLVEPKLYPPPDMLYPSFHYTGACRWQPAHDSVDLAPLRQAVGGSPVPILTFGSMGYDDPQAWLRRLARHWPSGNPLIVQSGWANFQPLAEAPWLHIVGKMPQDELFQLASVVIHHGGAGTTATALASGKPQILVPHVAEQWHWAQEMQRLGCGRRLAQRHWPEKLHGTIQRILGEPAYSRRAQELLPLARDESGPVRAADRIERLARTSGPWSTVTRAPANQR